MLLSIVLAVLELTGRLWQKRNHLVSRTCKSAYQFVRGNFKVNFSQRFMSNELFPCFFSGLVLQDLTFVHIGNSDLLPDGTINFSKRWQQFNIVENMKRFKKGYYSFFQYVMNDVSKCCFRNEPVICCRTYSFKKHERIITFFNNFSDFLCEEAMWQISESIKPRGGKKAQSQN